MPVPVTVPPPACQLTSGCTLADAGRFANVLIGSAAKPGDPAVEALQLAQFDALSTEDEFLWSSIHPAPDVWNFAAADAVVDYAVANGKVLTATHFLWDPPTLRSVLPQWVRSITEPDELRSVLRVHLETLHARYGDRIDRLNVVNEAIGDGELERDNHFYDVLGPGYVDEAFALAAEIWPEAELVLNQDRSEYDPAVAEALIELTDDLVAAGRRVDRVGLQAHLFFGEPDRPLLATTMARLAALDVAVDLTELDIPNRGFDGRTTIGADAQAARAARIVRTCLDQPGCESITFWGIDDGDSWLDTLLGPGTAPLLYDAALRPKSMRTAIVDELLLGR